MTQTTGHLFNELAKFMTDAAGMAEGVRSEVEQLVRAQISSVLKDLDQVSREEMEANMELSKRSREEILTLSARVQALELEVERLDKAQRSAGRDSEPKRGGERKTGVRTWTKPSDDRPARSYAKRDDKSGDSRPARTGGYKKDDRAGGYKKDERSGPRAGASRSAGGARSAGRPARDGKSGDRPSGAKPWATTKRPPRDS